MKKEAASAYRWQWQHLDELNLSLAAFDQVIRGRRRWSQSTIAAWTIARSTSTKLSLSLAAIAQDDDDDDAPPPLPDEPPSVAAAVDPYRSPKVLAYSRTPY